MTPTLSVRLLQWRCERSASPDLPNAKPRRSPSTPTRVLFPQANLLPAFSSTSATSEVRICAPISRSVISGPPPSARSRQHLQLPPDRLPLRPRLQSDRWPDCTRRRHLQQPARSRSRRQIQICAEICPTPIPLQLGSPEPLLTGVHSHRRPGSLRLHQQPTPPPSPASARRATSPPSPAAHRERPPSSP